MYLPRLRDLREDRDMTQAQVASLLGIDQRVYSNYETGKREIPLRHLIVLPTITTSLWIISWAGTPKICKSITPERM